ncbi:hypothetical protein Q3G72_000840 [Acer saccharum]|nr:hypothetical protein Q3G72_000840 [Acer saccharum]
MFGIGSRGQVTKQLALRPTFPNLNLGTDEVGFDKVRSVSKVVSSEEESRHDSNRIGSRVAVNVSSRGKKESCKVVRDRSMSSSTFVRKEVGGDKGLLEKGKGGESDGSDFSTSGFESEDGPVLNGLLLRGECSRIRPSARKITKGLSPKEFGSPDIYVSNSKERNMAQSTYVGVGGSVGDSGPIVKKVVGGLKKGCLESESQSLMEGRELLSPQIVLETQMINDRGIDLVVDLRDQERDVMLQEAGLGSLMADVCSEMDNGEPFVSKGSRGRSGKEGSENSRPKLVKRHKGKGYHDSGGLSNFKSLSTVQVEEEVASLLLHNPYRSVATNMKKKKRSCAFAAKQLITAKDRSCD